MPSYPKTEKWEDTSPSSPRYSSDESSNSRTHSPTWKSSKRRLLSIDPTRLIQLTVGFIALVLIFIIARAASSTSKQPQDFTRKPSPDRNHFVEFEGGLDCRISSQELYIPPRHDSARAKKAFPFCKDRAALLDAVSGGGRHGFDMPFTPRGCHYKWYTGVEICMILDRFDGVVFVGDELMHHIYAAFNILLRQDLKLGGLQQWKMSEKERDGCRCDRQYTQPDCSKYFVTSSDEVAESDSTVPYRAPYICNRAPHFYLPVRDSPAPGDLKMRFADLLNADPHSWKPVAIIHSLGLSTGFSWTKATESMDEWLTIADESGRNSPFLWVGPSAAGHLKPPTKIMHEGNNAMWHYTTYMAQEAWRRGVEALGLYNQTLQANSHDGSNYGERVNLAQAMQIINWLAKLESV